MNPVDLWTAALESGEYTQGQYSLHNTVNNTWCCLGVACDLYQKHGPGDLEIEDACDCRIFDRHNAVLPLKVMNWLGLYDECGTFQREGAEKYTSLVSMNDNGNMGFKGIAEKIKAKPKGLFIQGE